MFLCFYHKLDRIQPCQSQARGLLPALILFFFLNLFSFPLQMMFFVSMLLLPFQDLGSRHCVLCCSVSLPWKELFNSMEGRKQLMCQGRIFKGNKGREYNFFSPKQIPSKKNSSFLQINTNMKSQVKAAMYSLLKKSPMTKLST